MSEIKMTETEMSEADALALLDGPLRYAAQRVQLLHGEIKALRVGGEDSPVGIYDLLGTEQASGENSTTWESRRSRCYELAGYAAVWGAAPPECRLVHGSWHGPGATQRIGHAWLEIPTPAGLLIWEPISATLFEAQAFHRWTSNWDERTYSVPAATRLLHLNQNFGRWHESRYP